MFASAIVSDGAAIQPMVTEKVSPSTLTSLVAMEWAADASLSRAPPCRSGRHSMDADGASVTDEDVMAKAMRRKAEKNLDTIGTSSSSKSFTFFSPSRIMVNLSSLGVSLGKNSRDIMVSISVLKQMEYDRLTVAPKVFNM
jgi:hypothetical protein